MTHRPFDPLDDLDDVIDRVAAAMTRVVADPTLSDRLRAQIRAAETRTAFGHAPWIVGAVTATALGCALLVWNGAASLGPPAREAPTTLADVVSSKSLAPLAPHAVPVAPRASGSPAATAVSRAALGQGRDITATASTAVATVTALQIPQLVVEPLTLHDIVVEPLAVPVIDVEPGEKNDEGERQE